MRDEALLNRLGGNRLASRQIDELTGLARGLCADGVLNQKEVEFLEKWLAANAPITGSPMISTWYDRVADMLADGIADSEERAELLHTLESFCAADFELGEALKSTKLPLCSPPPELRFAGRSYCFTGTFSYGSRAECESAVAARGASSGSLTRKTDVLVIGVYATESWKHAAFGNKILKATEMRDRGFPICIVSESHWLQFL